MGTPKDWPHAESLDQWMRNQEKRIMREERRPKINQASDLLGPGIAPRAVVISDWNSEAARSFNGFFYSPIGSDNTPDDTKAWMGLSVSTGNHVQQVAWSHGTGVVEGFVRTGHQHSAGTPEFSAWEPMQADVPDVAIYLNDLLDVTLASVANGEILMYDGGTSQWKNHTFAHTHTGSDVSTVQPTVNPVPRVILGPGAAIVTWDAKATETYDVYVAQSNASAPTSADLHPDFVGVRPPVWVRTTPGGAAITTTGSFYFAVRARNAGGNGPALTSADWVEGRAGTVDPQYLVLNADVAGINELFVEILQAVDVSVSGDFTANTLTAVGKATFMSNLNNMAAGSVLYLEKGITAPTTPLAVVQDWPYVALSSSYRDGVIYSGTWYDVQGSGNVISAVNTTTGAATTAATLTEFKAIFSITNLGGNFYVSGDLNSTGTTVVRKYNSSWVYQSVQWQPPTGSPNAMTNNGTNLILVYTSGTTVKWDFVNPTTGAKVGSSVTSVLTGASAYSAVHVNIGGTDRLFIASTLGSNIKAYNPATGAALTDWDFPTPVTYVWTVLWDGSNFKTHGTSPASRLYSHNDDTWTDTLSRRWVAPTWHDGGTATQTDLGTSFYYTAKKRARTTLTMSTPPPSGTDRVYVYMGRTDTATTTIPTRLNMWRVGSIVPSPGSVVITSAPDLTTTPHPPANNGFGTSTPAAIKSFDGTYTGFNADGDATLRNISGTMTTGSVGVGTFRDSVQALIDAASPAWTSWTPVLEATTTNPATPTVTAAYQKVGRTIRFRAKIVLNGSGSGVYRISYPGGFAPASGDDWPIGNGYVTDDSASLNYAVTLVQFSASRMQMLAANSTIANSPAARVSNTHPFGFNTPDIIWIRGEYESAT